jgi:alanyl-tRNA synthetase
MKTATFSPAQFLGPQAPLILEFEAEIREIRALSDGRLGAILDQTYFYPTGGGQEHDTGNLGAARVIDVLRETGSGLALHIIDRPLAPGKIHAAIDRDRRLRHMQHHTGQHLLSGCFEQLFGLETLSANINGYSPSTLDLPVATLSTADLRRAEELANQIIYENRAVKWYFVPPDQIDSIPLRKPPKVSENIRIVEIDGFDYSACGATHCPQTGMIGVLKIVRAEAVRQNSRIHFVAGWQALELFRQSFESIAQLAAEMSTHPSEVPTLARRQAELLQAAQKELAQLRLERATAEAAQLVAQARPLGSRRIVLASFENRSPNELRALANELKSHPGVAALLASFDGHKLSAVAVCAPESGVSARQLLDRQLAIIAGRGGGDDQIAQGGGAASPEQFAAFFDDTMAILANGLAEE